MNNQSIPLERDLPAGHLEARRQHLLAEARSDARTIAIPRLLSRDMLRHRRVWLPAIATCAAAVAALLVLQPYGNGPQQTASSAHPKAVAVSIARTSPGKAWRATAPASLVSIDVPATVARAFRPSAEISGGTSAQQALLRTILARMPGNLVTRVAIVTATAGGRSGVTLKFGSASTDAMRSEWEEHLLAGAFRDLSATAGLPAVVGYPSPWPVHATYAPGAAAALQAKLRSAAESVRAHVVALTMYRPDGLAPLVVLGVPASTSPGEFLEVGLPRFLAALGNPWRDYDGTFVEVVDHDQSFIWAAGTTPRASEGSVGTRPDLAGCSPVANWGPTPPPCPAR